jgi:hypothetical protein
MQQYDDLIGLARVCLMRASAARTPAVAGTLREMADDYQARADRLIRCERSAKGTVVRPMHPMSRAA